jgi:hypothetical protein
MVSSANIDSLREISTIEAALGYGANALGRIPRYRRNRPPVVSLLRPTDTYTMEAELRKINNGNIPDTFILSTYGGMLPPPAARSNTHAARQGRPVGFGDKGQNFKARETDVQITLNSTLFSNNLATIYNYNVMVLEYNVVVGVMNLDAMAIPVSVTISEQMQTILPIPGIASSVFLDQLFSLSFTATIDTRAVTLERTPLLRTVEFATQLNDVIDISVKTITNDTEWGL